jgi:hypothetical protein
MQYPHNGNKTSYLIHEILSTRCVCVAFILVHHVYYFEEHVNKALHKHDIHTNVYRPTYVYQNGLTTLHVF